MVTCNALIVMPMYEPARTEGVGGWPARPALLSIGMTAERYRNVTYIIARDVCCLRLFVIHRADLCAVAAVTVASFSFYTTFTV